MDTKDFIIWKKKKNVINNIAASLITERHFRDKWEVVAAFVEITLRISATFLRVMCFEILLRVTETLTL